SRKGAARSAHAAVAAWEPALAEQGAVLVRARREWATAHAARFSELSRAIGETQPAALAYSGSAAEAADPLAELLTQLERQREQDLRRCLTHAGPHRDDLVLRLDAHDLRQVGSAGQRRTAAIVLRMLESATHREATGVVPALLLDDPFAELDRRRTSRILALLEEEGVGQCVLCVPREDEIPAQFTRLERWSVRAGTFSR